MTQTFTIGPLMFPMTLLLGLLAYFVGSWVGKRVGRRAGLQVEPMLFRMLLAGAIAARLAFVVQFHAAYARAPLEILDIRDGGWTPLAGLAVAAAYALAVGLRRKGWGRPLAAAIGTAGAVWIVGALALGALGQAARLPALRMSALDGQPVTLTDFLGKPTVVNLWATWCPPCRREMPVLQQAQAERADVNFVFVNQGESAQKVQSWLAAQQLPLRNVVLDARGEAGVAMGARGLPTTLFFDAQGRLADTRVGELSRATLAQRLNAIASVAPPK